ncbi:glycerol-3-phosphate transporter periplasmic binding protein [Raoultella planticola]|uniref:Glycerol-3-phosphate transporter periplasmic binding protein n=1 Tax=Raoultella planticola TaxID=575 RepID=A0A485ANA6_RAOPL|nr:glycerol-3-phosphate transporter periplasmic binding protein [Raoultella planticola]
MPSAGTALAKEKIDFMFPAPVDGKLTMEMTRVIKAFNDSQQDVEVRGIFTGNYDTTKIKAESAQKAGQPPALVIMSANFTTDLALKDEILPMDELFPLWRSKSGRLPGQRVLAGDAQERPGDGHHLRDPVP